MSPEHPPGVISVVIPYFQRAEGILSKALASIAAQRDCALPIHVIVVDDSSPVPAHHEVERLGAMPHSVQIVKQANAGPGAARNTGLHHMPEHTRAVAFLDSDDEWTPEHLMRAVLALEAGHDVYFADHFQLGQTTSAFVRGNRIHPKDHPEIVVKETALHKFSGDMLDQIIRGNVIGTSTVVYDARRFGAKRFKAEFTNAGEDYLFWMDLAHSAAKFAFSSVTEARYGRGVNVYSGAGWGSDEHLLRIHNELKYRKTTLRLFRLNPDQKSHVASSIRLLRTAFLRDILHRLMHRKAIPGNLLAAHVALDPLGLLLLPYTALKLVTAKS